MQIERAITNIIKNGLEAIQEGPARERRIRISYHLNNKDFIGLAIEDAGPGLPANPNNVFRFLKSTKAHGSGLGLLISKKIVEAHGGKLVANRSADLGGAKFEILLPRGGNI